MLAVHYVSGPPVPGKYDKKEVILKSVAILTMILLLSFHLFGDEIDSLLTKWEERLKDEKLISCKMIQTKKISYLKDPVKISGTFYFKYPNLFRLEMRGDENYDLFCDGMIITIVNHDLDEKEVYELKDLDPNQGGRRLLPPLINQTRADIKANFHISFITTDTTMKIGRKPYSRSGKSMEMYPITFSST